MEKIKNIINNSYYATIGYIDSIESFNILEQYILYNLPILYEFKGIIVATTYKKYNDEYIDNNKKLWKKYFPTVILIDIPINRGHSFGTADCENSIIDYCKENNINWICKSSNDIIIQQKFLDKEVESADLYYLNGIGYGGMIKYNFDFQRIVKEDFYPQTNFYIINVSKIDYLYDKHYINETYNYIQTITNYNGKVWEYIQDWACEEFLKKCTQRNNLSRFHLIPNNKYLNLLNIIKTHQIHDSSHKNIMIDGICHFQYPNQTVMEI